MEKPEFLLRDLVTQVSRVAYALEVVAHGMNAMSSSVPCRNCGCILLMVGLPSSTCPACKTENAR